MRTHYVNADFDLSLRARGAGSAGGAQRRQAQELTVQGLLGADDGDRALLRCRVPDEFLDHLAASGLTPARPLEHPRIAGECELRPYGWNAEAIALNRLHARPVAHPQLAVIRRVNARSYGVALERELGLAVAPGRVVGEPSELAAHLESAPVGGPWVVKAEHGNAGLGNLRIRTPRMEAAARRFVSRCFEADDLLVVEPWLPRRRDWCTVFDVPLGDAGPRIHESICTDGGSLIGALFEPGGVRESPWAEKLDAVAATIAERLERDGYFGPVCLDSFTWLDGGVERLRPLVDLNCRRAMTERAHAAWRRLAPRRTLYYRFFNSRKLDLPAGLAETVSALGSRRYDPRTRRGILLATPPTLEVDGETRSPTKLAVFFVADTRESTFEHERWFRKRFEA